MEGECRGVALVRWQYQRRSLGHTPSGQRRGGGHADARLVLIDSALSTCHEVGLVLSLIQFNAVGGIHESELCRAVGPVLLGSAAPSVGTLEVLVLREYLRGDEGAGPQVTLQQVDGRVVHAADEAGVHDSILASACDVQCPFLVLRPFGAAVRASNADLVYGDGIALAHAGSGDVLGRGDEYFDAVAADEAVEGREPLLVFGHGEGEVVRSSIVGSGGGRGEGGRERLGIEGWQAIDGCFELIFIVTSQVVKRAASGWGGCLGRCLGRCLMANLMFMVRCVLPISRSAGIVLVLLLL
mmetsp:Transcript_21492/g.44978  ORF Transcript_21492/g.44978 Transcript_21492/m.44978 type:complete len:298 (-) Transcript_21492:785-1678(-)